MKLKFEMKKLNWLWAILLIVFSAILSTIMIQYLLLDAELFEKLSDKKWMLNIGCVLVVYLFTLGITARVNLSVVISHCFFMLLSSLFLIFPYMLPSGSICFYTINITDGFISIAENIRSVIHFVIISIGSTAKPNTQ